MSGPGFTAAEVADVLAGAQFVVPGAARHSQGGVLADVPDNVVAMVPTSTVAAPARLGSCIATFREWLHMPDPGALLVTLATVAANRAEGDPVWLLVVGPPGGGKTEIINAIVRQRDVRAAATLTEAALLSGTPKRDQASGAKGGLLREIGTFGIIVLKDFGSVLSMNRDTRGALLAALREVYDGSWTRHVGTDGGRVLSWEGKLALIAGCTPAIDSHHAVMGSMGERFVLYRLPKMDADVQTRRALGHVGKESIMRRALADAVDLVLAGVDESRLLLEPNEATVDRLVNVATVAVRCRSAVERDPYNREITLIPEAEAPARLALVLLRLANGLPAIGVDEDTTWQLVSKCALDSMPAVRRTVLEDLLARGGVAVSTSAIATRAQYPTTTALRALQDLAAHGVVQRHSQGAGKADLWQLTAWTRRRWPTSPEMSVKSRTEHESEAQAGPLYLPLRVDDDKSGEVPWPVWDSALATDDDGEVSA